MKSAVLIIDVQNGIFAMESRPYEADLVVQNICEVASQARARGDEIIFIQHEAEGIVDYGSDRWQLYGGLDARESDWKIRKSTANAFFNSDLDDVLIATGAKDLIICGYASDICIDRTTFSAASRGYSVTLVEDAHTTQSKGLLSAKQIRNHHNTILSMHPRVNLAPAHAVYKDSTAGQAVDSINS